MYTSKGVIIAIAKHATVMGPDNTEGPELPRYTMIFAIAIYLANTFE